MTLAPPFRALRSDTNAEERSPDQSLRSLLGEAHRIEAHPPTDGPCPPQHKTDAFPTGGPCSVMAVVGAQTCGRDGARPSTGQDGCIARWRTMLRHGRRWCANCRTRSASSRTSLHNISMDQGIRPPPPLQSTLLDMHDTGPTSCLPHFRDSDPDEVVRIC